MNHLATFSLTASMDSTKGSLLMIPLLPKLNFGHLIMALMNTCFTLPTVFWTFSTGTRINIASKLLYYYSISLSLPASQVSFLTDLLLFWQMINARLQKSNHNYTATRLYPITHLFSCDAEGFINLNGWYFCYLWNGEEITRWLAIFEELNFTANNMT